MNFLHYIKQSRHHTPAIGCMLAAQTVATDGKLSYSHMGFLHRICQDDGVPYEAVEYAVECDPYQLLTDVVGFFSRPWDNDNNVDDQMKSISKAGILQLSMITARADDNLSHSEYLMIETIAHALRVPKSLLAAIHRDLFGSGWPAAQDPSRVEYYVSREERARNAKRDDDDFNNGDDYRHEYQHEDEEEDAWGDSDMDLELALTLLVLERNASVEQIKSAFHELAKKYHPDAHPHITDSERIELQEKFIKVKAAYDFLLEYYG